MPDDALQFNKEQRWLALDSTLDGDDVLVTALNGTDFISAPFVYQIELQTTLADNDVKKLLGQSVTVWLGYSQTDSDRRPINGMVRRLSGPALGSRNLKIWRAEVVPLLAFLDLSADCLIFQDMAIPDIIKAVFSAHNLTSFELRGLMNSYPKLDYCVQYRETAFNFVSRLMEHVGLFYWHEHTDGDHKLVISDNNHVAKAAMSQPAVQETRTRWPDVREVELEHTFHTGKWSLNDFNYLTPATSLLADTVTLQSTPVMSTYEVYDYPGSHTATDQGKALTRLRIEHEEVNFVRATGIGFRPAFDAGESLTIQPADGSAPGDDDKYLLVQVHHIASNPNPWDTMGTAASEGEEPYQNRFIGTLLKNPFRPDRTAPKPFVRGVQTAIVTGAPGDIVATDQYGRVKVQFPWDRKPGANGNTSCWVRVSQAWADKSFGAMWIPRVGEEVIVDFVEGDPDRPIITGRVYNAVNVVPYALPANKTQSGFKSHSVPGSGSNELRFEDKGGSEEVYLHGQKDLTVVVENNETRTIKNNQTEKVTNNLQQTVGGTLTQNVAGAVSETYGNTYSQTVTGAVTIQYDSSRSETVAGSTSETVAGSVTQNYVGSLTQNVMGGINIMTPLTFTTVAVGGYNLIQPTSAWQTGPTSLSAYGFAFAAYGAQVQVVGSSTAAFGIQVQAIGMNLQINGMTETISGLHFEDINGAELKNVGVELSTAATKIKTAILHLFA